MHVLAKILLEQIMIFHDLSAKIAHFDQKSVSAESLKMEKTETPKLKQNFGQNRNATVSV